MILIRDPQRQLYGLDFTFHTVYAGALSVGRATDFDLTQKHPEEELTTDCLEKVELLCQMILFFLGLAVNAINQR